jgi:hypothetical protein
MILVKGRAVIVDGHKPSNTNTKQQKHSLDGVLLLFTFLNQLLLIIDTLLTHHSLFPISLLFFFALCETFSLRLGALREPISTIHKKTAKSAIKSGPCFVGPLPFYYYNLL